MKKCGEKMYPRKLIGNLSTYTNETSISKMDAASNLERFDSKILSTAPKKATELDGT